MVGGELTLKKLGVRLLPNRVAIALKQVNRDLAAAQY